jgi:hypothetical protein
MSLRRIAAAAAGVVAVALLTSACGDPSTVEDEPVQVSPEEPATEATLPATSAASPTEAVARVGDTLELTGTSDGEKMAVTVVRFVDPARGGQFDEPSQGQRFVAVQFRLRNIGTAAYDDSPSNSAVVVDSVGQRFNSSIADTSAGASFPGSITIAPQDTGLGFITFEVPKSSRIAKVQFALNSGFADQTGQWLID